MARGGPEIDDMFDDDFLNLARGGFLGRRAHRLVYFIESQVAFHNEQLLWACRLLLGKARAEWQTRDVFSGFELRNHDRKPLSIHDLERHAAEWGRLLPAVPRLQANVAHILNQKYKCAALHLPQMRRALGLDSAQVQAAYKAEYGVDAEHWGLGGDESLGARVSLDSAPSSHQGVESAGESGDRSFEERVAAGAPAEEILLQEAEWLGVPGGEAVVREGEPMDSLYVVASGRLRTDPASTHTKDVREYTRGDVLGEVSLLAGVEWRSTVRAVRDGELVRISRAAVVRMLEAFPRQGLELTQALVTRAAVSERGVRNGALTIALLPLDSHGEYAIFAQRLADALAASGPALRLEARTVDDAVTAGASEARPGDDLDGMVASWLSVQETHHKFVLYQADVGVTPWTERCLRQADRVILVARAGSDPGLRAVEKQLNKRIETHLVLLQNEDTLPTGTAAWVAQRTLRFHHHVRLALTSDIERVARLVSGNAVGIVFGGGGARGFSHPGVIQALEEYGVALDLIGGSSMGAVAAGLAAMGWPGERIRRLGERLDRRNALFDYTLPFMSIMAGRRVSAFLRSVFGEVMIEDLWTPFFCVSTNLTRGGVAVHRSGPLWEAVRASVALPGIFSPVLHEGDVLVDGAVLNNLPLDVMRDLCGTGTVIGVLTNIATSEFGPHAFSPDPSGWRILWQRLKGARARLRVPSIFSILMRSFDIKDARAQQDESLEHRADILIEPDTTGLGFLDFGAYEAMAEAGYIAACKALAAHEERLASTVRSQQRG